MPSKSLDTALRDILHHIDLASNFSAGFDPASFKHDIKTVYAVTRCLEIISEAFRRLPDDLKARHPAIGWKQMAGAATSIATIPKTLPLSLFGKLWRGRCRPYAS